MKMKPVVPTATIRDPFTKLPLSPNGEDVPEDGDRGVFWTRRWLEGEAAREEGGDWVRRLPNGEIARERIAASPSAAPESAPSTAVLNAPVTPLVTR